MPAEAILIVLALAAAATSGVGALILMRSRLGTAERERRRRLEVGRRGRMSDGMVTEVVGQTVFFSYSVMGVDYTASQDLSALRDRLPEDLASLIGPVTLKYLAANPANSIIASEEWFGFHTRYPILNRINSTEEIHSR
jgi:hypothetical protein